VDFHTCTVLTPAICQIHQAPVIRFCRFLLLYRRQMSVHGGAGGARAMLPKFCRERSVQAHKYIVGDVVYFTSGMIGRANGSGSYQVVRLLPPDGEEFQYRIKKADDAYERVAKESQLDTSR
jgi:hypothetical protein